MFCPTGLQGLTRKASIDSFQVFAGLCWGFIKLWMNLYEAKIYPHCHIYINCCLGLLESSVRNVEFICTYCAIPYYSMKLRLFCNIRKSQPWSDFIQECFPCEHDTKWNSKGVKIRLWHPSQHEVIMWAFGDPGGLEPWSNYLPYQLLHHPWSQHWVHLFNGNFCQCFT